YLLAIASMLALPKNGMAAISSARSKVLSNWSSSRMETEVVSTATITACPPVVDVNHQSVVNEMPKSDSSESQTASLVDTSQQNGNQSLISDIYIPNRDNPSAKSVEPKPKKSKTVPKNVVKKKSETNNDMKNELKIKMNLNANPKPIEKKRRISRRNGNKPVVVKDLSDAKGFLAFCTQKYPPTKEGIPFIQDRSTALEWVLKLRGLVVYAFAEEGNATHTDTKLWLPHLESKNLDPMNAQYLLTFVGQQFCQIYADEQRVMKKYVSITWKKPVKGVRELCDVCKTTIFNTHYVCPNCGFAVCVDCFDVRQESTVRPNPHSTRGKSNDEFGWSLCHEKRKHDKNDFHLALFITKAVFALIDLLSHQIRNDYRIPGICECNQLDPKLNVDMRQQCATVDVKTMYPDVPRKWYFSDRMLVLTEPKCLDNLKLFQLYWLKGYPVMIQNVDKYLNRDIWTPQVFNKRSLCHEKRKHDKNDFHLALFITKAVFALIDLLSHQIRNDYRIPGICECNQLDPKLNVDMRQQCATVDVKTMYPDVPRQWYFSDRMLVLTEPKCFDNLKLFQLYWLKGYPVMIQNVDKYLNRDIWTPQVFNKRYGKQSNLLVNCMNGDIIKSQPMSVFWDGFEDIDKRLKDEKGNEMIFKLKDWPPYAEFRDILPIWFDDLMQALPLQEYTRYNGTRNIASRLPDYFVRPDLGPKMYCAYGSVLHADKGTTNLHLDMSDAINVMVYVGVAQQDNKPLESHLKAAADTFLKGGCDPQMMSRATNCELTAGALWHIWRAEDADKMREFILKVAKEDDLRIDPNSDPIHDQSWYIDETLRKRLEVEYDVKGLAIVQCLGDAILVPAGAPHQVQNIHSCIKVAGEFVSPENVGHCVTLTQEFRKLSKRHNNHEDKLQIKNIIYHTIKDSLSLLLPQHRLASLLPKPPPIPVPQSPHKVLLNSTPSFNANSLMISEAHKPLDPQTASSPIENSLLTPPNSVEKLKNDLNGETFNDNSNNTVDSTLTVTDAANETDKPSLHRSRLGLN
ncbi:unnamed protein product, partial [Oppiella nova]